MAIVENAKNAVALKLAIMLQEKRERMEIALLIAMIVWLAVAMRLLKLMMADVPAQPVIAVQGYVWIPLQPNMALLAVREIVRGEARQFGSAMEAIINVVRKAMVAIIVPVIIGMIQVAIKTANVRRELKIVVMSVILVKTKVRSQSV